MIIKTLPSHGIDIYYDGTKLMASDTANGGYEVSRADIIAGKLVFVRHGAFQNPSFSYEVKSTDGRMSDEADYEIGFSNSRNDIYHTASPHKAAFNAAIRDGYSITRDNIYLTGFDPAIFTADDIGRVRMVIESDGTRKWVLSPSPHVAGQTIEIPTSSWDIPNIFIRNSVNDRYTDLDITQVNIAGTNNFDLLKSGTGQALFGVEFGAEGRHGTIKRISFKDGTSDVVELSATNGTRTTHIGYGKGMSLTFPNISINFNSNLSSNRQSGSSQARMTII